MLCVSAVMHAQMHCKMGNCTVAAMDAGVQTDAKQEDPEGVEDLGSTSDGDVEANEDQQDISPAIRPIVTLGLQYPPAGEVACRLSTCFK